MRGWIGIAVLAAWATAACGGGGHGSTAVRGPAPGFDPVGIAFSSPSDGVAVGGGTIATTSDGGRTWTTRRRGRRPLAAVTIAPAGTAYATIGRCSETCPGAGGLLASTDGGRTWAVRSRQAVYRPSFATPADGWALAAEGGTTGLALTHDGGRRWAPLPDPCPRAVPVAVAALTARSAELVCASGNAATNMESKAVLRTRDAGRSWRTLAVAAPPGAPPAGVGAHGLPAVGVMPGMTMLPGGRGWLWADRGRLAATSDGVSWHTVTRAFQPDVDVVRSVDFLDGRTGYALDWRDGATRLLRSDDGGRTWTAVHAWRPRL